MKKIHIYHIVSLLFAIAIGSATMAQQTDATLEFGHVEIAALESGYSSITVEGCNSLNRNIGAPELPTLQWLVDIDEGAWIEIVGKDSVWVDLGEADPIRPAQPSQFKNNTTTTWDINYGIYEQDSLYGLPWGTLTPLGTMGRTRLARVTIAPVKYNPVSNQLLIYNRIQYCIHGLSQQKAMANEELYVAVVPRKYAEIAQPLLQWRQQLGWKVETIYTMDGDKDSVRNALKGMYRRRMNPTYVLLMGGVADIKAFSGRKAPSGLDNRLCDMYYGEYTNDGYPEAMVGRLSVNDSAELRIVIDKILNYEQNPDTTTVDKALVVAGGEDRHPAPITTNGQVNYVGERLSGRMDTICFRNPESVNLRDSILGTLGSGMGLINYTAHCVYDKWSRPSLTASDVAGVSTHASIWINNCCSSNKLGANSLGENLLRQSNGGGVGIIGATNETLWDEDYYWSVGAKRPYTLQPAYNSTRMGGIDHLLKKETLGEMVKAGNMAVTTVGSPYDAYYWEIYNLYGDPATRPYMGIAPRLSSPTTSALHIGVSEVNIVGATGACVTIWQSEKIVGKCVLDAMGNGHMSLSRPLLGDEMIITTSKAWHRPQVDTLQPQPAQGEWIVAELIAEQDSIDWGEEVPIKIAYQNVGDATALNHQIRLIQTAEDSVGAWMAQPITIDIERLEVGETDTVSGMVKLSRLSEMERLKMRLVVSHAMEHYIEQPMEWRVTHSKIEGSLSITHEGLKMQRLMPHQHYTVEWKLENKNSYPMEQITSKIVVEEYPHRGPLWQEEEVTLAAEGDSTLRMEWNTDDTLQGVWIMAETRYGELVIAQSGWWIAGSAVEDFEAGTLEQYDWENGSIMPWTIDSTVSHSGDNSLKSGTIEDRQRCDIGLWVDVTVADTLGFWYRTSSEGNMDKLHLYMDGVERFFASGNQDWKYWWMKVPAGRHKLVWRYQKNDSGTAGEDAVWIDDIRWPMARWERVCGGMDSVIYNTSVGIEQVPMQSAWEVWPNPATEKINIRCDQSGTITLWDGMGNAIDEIKIENSNTTQYSTKELRFGLYLLVYTNSEGTSTKKLMITPKK